MRKPLFFFLLLFLVLLPSVLTSKGIYESENQTKHISYSWWGHSVRNKATIQVIDEYEKTHPDITISYSYDAFENYHNTLKSQLITKTLPDVFSFDSKWLHDMKDFHLFVLDQYIDTSHLDTQILNQFCRNKNGQLIGIPVGVNGIGMLCNKDFFLNFHIPITNDWTWDTLLTYGKSVHEKNKDSYLLCFPASQWSYFVRTYLQQCSGHDIISEEGIISCTASDLAQVFNFILLLLETETIPPFEISSLYEGELPDKNPFWNEGKIGMMPVSSSTVPDIISNSKVRCSSIRYPIMNNAVDNGIYVAPTMIVGVKADCKHIPEAIDFINFMLFNPQAQSILGTKRGIPMNYYGNKTETDNIVYQIVEQAMSGRSKKESTYNTSADVNALLLSYIHKIGFHKITPDAAAIAFVSDLTAILGQHTANNEQ
jgi:oligogalacturonide transport system substrate-binding protein